ncbi:prolactin-releasing peptide receptor-like [Stylophora pistillata]|nr:prolactin-releasing peptide receptor-like [Stylophora pistillata]
METPTTAVNSPISVRNGEFERNNSSSFGTPQQAGFVFLYSITILVALSGNFLLIFIVKWRPQARSLTRVLFVNMAVADIFVTLAVMPESMSFVFTLGKWFPGDLGLVTCAGVRYLNFTSLAASIGSLLLMSVDRYLGVTFPLDRFPKFRRGRILSVGIWLSATITSIPVAVTWKNVQYRPNGTFYCAPLFQSPGKNFKMIFYYLYLFFLMYLIPLLVISTLYFSVCRRLRKRNIPGFDIPETKQRNEATKQKVVRMLMIITAVFAICWLPSQVYSVAALGFFPDVHYVLLPRYVQYLFNWLGHANSAINPWLCLTLSETLREALCKVLKRDQHSNSRYSKSTRSQTSTKYTSVKSVRSPVPMPDAHMDSKEIHDVCNDEEEQNCRETNV